MTWRDIVHRARELGSGIRHLDRDLGFNLQETPDEYPDPIMLGAMAPLGKQGHAKPRK